MERTAKLKTGKLTSDTFAKTFLNTDYHHFNKQVNQDGVKNTTRNHLCNKYWFLFKGNLEQSRKSGGQKRTGSGKDRQEKYFASSPGKIGKKLTLTQLNI